MIDEARAMIRVSKHNHIVNFQGICVEKESVYLLLEYCALGQIDEFLRKHAKRLTKKQCHPELVQWCAEVADGMAFLVKKNIIHVSSYTDSFNII